MAYRAKAIATNVVDGSFTKQYKVSILFTFHLSQNFEEI